MDHTDFGLGLILAEEREHLQDHEQDEPMVDTELIVIERSGFTTNSAFPFQEPGTSMPIAGPGTLVNAVLIVDVEDFSVSLTVDDQDVLNTSFQTLQRQSQALERIAAFQRNIDDQYVFAASGYEFQHSVNLVIQPNTELDVDLQRAEIDLVRDP